MNNMTYSVVHATKGILFEGGYDECQQYLFEHQDNVGSLIIDRLNKAN